MNLIRGVTYWGLVGTKEARRRINIIETRNSGTRYVNWTNKKKDGSDGQNSWTREEKFREWVKGIYELN